MTFLIVIGRIVVIFGAVITIGSFAVYGYSMGLAQEPASLYSIQPDHISPTVAIFAVLGFLAGIIAAGTVFGLAAAIFDIQNSLRILTEGKRGNTSGFVNYDSIPDVQSGHRLEPRID